MEENKMAKKFHKIIKKYGLVDMRVNAVIVQENLEAMEIHYVVSDEIISIYKETALTTEPIPLSQAIAHAHTNAREKEYACVIIKDKMNNTIGYFDVRKGEFYYTEMTDFQTWLKYLWATKKKPDQSIESLTESDLEVYKKFFLEKKEPTYKKHTPVLGW